MYHQVCAAPPIQIQGNRYFSILELHAATRRGGVPRLLSVIGENSSMVLSNMVIKAMLLIVLKFHTQVINR